MNSSSRFNFSTISLVSKRLKENVTWERVYKTVLVQSNLIPRHHYMCRIKSVSNYRIVFSWIYVKRCCVTEPFALDFQSYFLVKLKKHVRNIVYIENVFKFLSIKTLKLLKITLQLYRYFYQHRRVMLSRLVLYHFSLETFYFILATLFVTMIIQSLLLSVTRKHFNKTTILKQRLQNC